MADLLIIDDDLDMADALSELMQAEGHHVRVGYNGEEGYSLVQEVTPDVAILDVEMPVLNGPGMAYKMFVHDMGLEYVPVVLLSGVANLEEVASMVGTPYFHSKPYSCEDVVELVGRALIERRAPVPRGPDAGTPARP